MDWPVLSMQAKILEGTLRLKDLGGFCLEFLLLQIRLGEGDFWDCTFLQYSSVEYTWYFLTFKSTSALPYQLWFFS